LNYKGYIYYVFPKRFFVMIPLECGLPVYFDKEEDTLVFEEPLAPVMPSVRTIEEMESLLLEPSDRPKILYYMYRDVHLFEHRELIRKHRVRYDFTLIPPAKVGLEFVKTAGHFHDFVPGTKLRYPEVYEVLHGTGHFLIQGSDDVFVVEAGVGEHVLVPPNYGHVTINPRMETLIMSNWVSDAFSSLYGPIKERSGAFYYELATGEFVENENYDEIPKLRHEKPKDYKELGLVKGRPMYTELVKAPETFRWLNEPEKRRWKGIFS
jgi:glucose-6-phosphate isomerase